MSYRKESATVGNEDTSTGRKKSRILGFSVSVRYAGTFYFVIRTEQQNSTANSLLYQVSLPSHKDHNTEKQSSLGSVLSPSK